MMAMLFAQRVILGKTEFDQVPAKLKAQVADILVNECGLPELVPAEFGGTADAKTAQYTNRAAPQDRPTFSTGRVNPARGA